MVFIEAIYRQVGASNASKIIYSHQWNNNERLAPLVVFIVRWLAFDMVPSLVVLQGYWRLHYFKFLHFFWLFRKFFMVLSMNHKWILWEDNEFQNKFCQRCPKYKKYELKTTNCIKHLHVNYLKVWTAHGLPVLHAILGCDFCAHIMSFQVIQYAVFRFFSIKDSPIAAMRLLHLWVVFFLNIDKLDKTLNLFP